MLRNSDGILLAKFSKFVRRMVYNEAEALAIPGALQLFGHHFPNKQVVESDSFNAIS